MKRKNNYFSVIIYSIITITITVTFGFVAYLFSEDRSDFYIPIASSLCYLIVSSINKSDEYPFAFYFKKISAIIISIVSIGLSTMFAALFKEHFYNITFCTALLVALILFLYFLAFTVLSSMIIDQIKITCFQIKYNKLSEDEKEQISSKINNKLSKLNNNKTEYFDLNFNVDNIFSLYALRDIKKRINKK